MIIESFDKFEEVIALLDAWKADADAIGVRLDTVNVKIDTERTSSTIQWVGPPDSDPGRWEIS